MSGWDLESQTWDMNNQHKMERGKNSDAPVEQYKQAFININADQRKRRPW
jgi:hypothetical protein